MSINLQGSSVKLMCGDHAIAKMYCQGHAIYSSVNTVTYHVDVGVSYQEEVDEGASCLSPKSFAIPTKSGYTFVGWSKSSNGAALSSCIMGDEPITLYAVWTYVGSPFYIVNGRTAVRGLSWSQNAASNIAAYGLKTGWAANDSYPAIGGVAADMTKGSSVTFVSASINAAGNHTIKLDIDVHSSNNSCLVTINGVQKQFSAGGNAVTFDISNVASFTITVTIKASAYDVPNCDFVTMALY